MSREDYIKGIIEIMNAEPDSWIIREIHRYALHMTAKGGACNG